MNRLQVHLRLWESKVFFLAFYLGIVSVCVPLSFASIDPIYLLSGWVVLVAFVVAKATPDVGRFVALSLGSSSWNMQRRMYQLFIAAVAAISILLVADWRTCLLTVMIGLVFATLPRRMPLVAEVGSAKNAQGKGRDWAPGFPASIESQLVVRPVVWAWLVNTFFIVVAWIGVFAGMKLFAIDESPEAFVGLVVGASWGAMVLGLTNISTLRNYLTFGGNRRRWAASITVTSGAMVLLFVVVGAVAFLLIGDAALSKYVVVSAVGAYVLLLLGIGLDLLTRRNMLLVIAYVAVALSPLPATVWAWSAMKSPNIVVIAVVTILWLGVQHILLTQVAVRARPFSGGIGSYLGMRKAQ
ncbi:MAG: hypothetical protein SOW59_08855 [Corynebacterium sp.]|nr:hypothetical protein [Corynebacterium sp.]